MNDLLIVTLQKLFDIENQIIQGLPLMREKAGHTSLQAGLEKHLLETKGQLKRLQKIGDDMQITLTGVTDMAMMYLLKEGMTTLDLIPDETIRDLAIVGNANKVEHYEMACYHSVIMLAKLSGLDSYAEELALTMNEEIAASEQLIQVADMITSS